MGWARGMPDGRGGKANWRNESRRDLVSTDERDESERGARKDRTVSLITPFFDQGHHPSQMLCSMMVVVQPAGAGGRR